MSLGVWLTPGYCNGTQKSLEMIGRLSTGRYGWFVPKRLLSKFHSPQPLSYAFFTSAEHAGFEHFAFDDAILRK